MATYPAVRANVGTWTTIASAVPDRVAQAQTGSMLITDDATPDASTAFRIPANGTFFIGGGKTMRVSAEMAGAELRIMDY